MNSGEQLYLPELQVGMEHIRVSGAEFHHLHRVRRYTYDDEIWAVNGKGLASRTRIKNIRQSDLDLEILEEVENRGESPQSLTLIIANLKGNRLEQVVEKTTELGVHCIIPVRTEHTVKKGVNGERLERIAVTAMKQSRRCVLPEITPLTPFADIVEKSINQLNLFCYSSRGTSTLIDIAEELKHNTSINIWVGPEGDWAEDEIDLARKSNYTFISLGERRLRAETAAMLAVGMVTSIKVGHEHNHNVEYR